MEKPYEKYEKKVKKKSEKYETFCVSKLNFQFGAGSTSLAVRVSPGRVILLLCYFEQNMLFLVKFNPEFSSKLLEEAKVTLALPLFLLAAKKKAIILSIR